MKQQAWRCMALAALFILMLGLAGCGGGDSAPSTPESTPAAPVPAEARRETRTTMLLPQQLQTVVYGNDTVSLDASCAQDGYILVRYTGQVQKIKLQLTMPDGTVYTYTLRGGDYEVFPLSGGSGSYCADVYENVSGKMYALAFSQKFDVALADEFKPYLYPNQYVWYTQDSDIYDLSIQLSDQSTDDLDYVRVVYDYITNNVTYDQELAENVPVGYLPDVDRTLEIRKGICFDYAALMTSLLRTQGIPTRLVVGYSGELYHAWISVYLDEIGWVNDIIYFDGSNWSLMDPTLGANNRDAYVKKYVGDGSNYVEKYHY